MAYLVCRFHILDYIRVDISTGKKSARRRLQNRKPFEIAKLSSTDIATWIENVDIKVDELPQRWNMLCDEARKNGLRRYGPEFHMSYNAIVAYVRHHKTNYECLLRDIECIPGGRALYYEPFKERVDAIVRNALQEQYGSLPVGRASDHVA